MASSVDYTPVLLAQLTDLQMRVTKQDATISALKAEVERISGKPVRISDATMRTSVPLRPIRTMNDSHGRDERQPRGERYSRDDRGREDRQPREDKYGRDDRQPRTRPKVAAESAPHPTMALSDVLNSDEQVTIQVHTGKDEEGNFVDATALATFDGTNLCVSDCELVASLVGMKSAKPGEILYKFIDELKTAGHIKRTFSIAPWKLCFVTRNGVQQSLEDLRTVIG
jgi:hypothetical protein